MVTVVVLASSVAGSDSTWDAATTAARPGSTGAGACSRTTRIRIPATSTSSSARLCLVASSTTSSTRHGRAPRASGLRDPLMANNLPGGDPPQVLAAPRIHLDHVTLVEEERNLDHGAGLERRRLRAASGCVAADAGIRLGDLQLDEVRQLDGDGVAVDEEDLDLGVLLEEVACLADVLRRERDLGIGVEVHEVVGVVLVGVLHAFLVEIDQLDLLTRAEGVVDDAPEFHVLQLGPHEGAPLAGLDVLEVDDAVRLAVELDLQPLLEFCGRYLHGPMTLSVFES